MGSTGGQKRKEYALITGASSGIGYELAKVFAQNGFNLVLVARNQERLETAAREFSRDFAVDCRVIPADLSQADDVEEVHRRVREENLDVTVLVNNAGVGSYGPFYQTDIRTEAQMINLNIVGLTRLTRLFVEEMVKNDSGKILNVASVTGFWPVPNMSVYAATKAYVISFSQALASELSGTGVQVSVLCPPSVHTGFLSGRQKKEAHGHPTLAGRVLQHVMYMDAATVAVSGHRDLMKGKRLITPSVFYRALRVVVKFVPQALVSDLRARRHRTRSSGGH